MDDRKLQKLSKKMLEDYTVAPYGLPISETVLVIPRGKRTKTRLFLAEGFFFYI